jgi:hypothetical protein
MRSRIRVLNAIDRLRRIRRARLLPWLLLAWIVSAGGAAAQLASPASSPTTSPSASPTPATCPAAVPRCDPTLFARREAVAVRVTGKPPVIDGHLDDAAWADAPIVTRLMQSRPDPGTEARMRTEARLLYDDHALYIAVRLFDPTPHDILAPFVRRDDETTSDWTFVEIDSRHDRRTGFSFGLNPRGVQVDGMWMDDINYDSTWDAVWEGAARVDADGWTAEYRIPFSQLPYTSPATEGDGETVWGLNIYRNSQRRGEVSNWSPRGSGLAGVISHFNDLHLRVPAHQRRVELTPYVAPRWERAAAGTSASAAHDALLGGSLNAGADLRVGLGSNFNLTATVLPDFGQVEQDPSQVNLTALELFQTERRPFFIEGVNAFRFDTSLGFTTRGDSFLEESPFYSRRIGHAPAGAPPPDASAFSMPGTTRLLGAAKLSGRTASGWTAGIFSAITGREEGTLRHDLAGNTDASANAVSERWPVEPLTATTVARVARDFNAGESTLGGFVSDTHRSHLDGPLQGEFARDALTVGVEGRHRFADQAYELRGWWLGTRLAGDAAAIAQVGEEPQHYFQRPDASQLQLAPDATSLSGFSAETRISRVSGRLTWSLATRAISPGFDLNAAGFQRNANWVLAAGSWQYQRFVSDHAVRAWAVGSDNAGIGWSWYGEPRARVINGFALLNFRNYWDVKVSVDRELPALSLDWLRGGPAVRLPARSTLRLSTHTDQRRPTNIGLDASLMREPDSASWGYALSPLFTVRSTDHLSWSIGPTFQQDVVGWQYVGTRDVGVSVPPASAEAGSDTGTDAVGVAGAVGAAAAASATAAAAGTGTSAADYLVARVRQRTVALTTRADLAFSSHLVLQFYAQPFATVGRYDRYQHLVAARAADAASQFARLDAVPSSLSPDATGRTLNGNLVLRWEYRPGSFFTAVWNHQRDTTLLDATRGLDGAFGALFRDPSTNVFLIKTSVRLGS